MKKFFIKKIVFISLLFSFLILSACDKYSDSENIDFTYHIDVKNLRIFAKEDVSPNFLNTILSFKMACVPIRISISQ